MIDNAVYVLTYEYRPTKSVKMSVGHLYPSFSGAYAPKCGAKMSQLIA
jgi:hypothetical protein